MSDAPSNFTGEHLWKDNWPQTRRRFLDWWRREGLLLGAWRSYDLDAPRADVPDPGPAPSVEAFYTDPRWRAAAERFRLARAACPAEMLPIANTDIGPGSLGTFLGAQPVLTYDTVWYKPWITDPDSIGPLRFDPDDKWWRIHDSIIAENVAASRGNYFVGTPDLIENIDTLAALRDNEPLMIDLIERPDWVKEKVAEINRVFFAAYDRIYDRIKLADGSAVFGPFRLWAPGKVAKLQCDASAMFSPAMLAEFVIPCLAEQCAWLDYSLYHLDGTQCIRHLDQLLAIEDLDAIEWTPQAGSPAGGAPEWYGLYRRILAAGKCVQAVGVKTHEVIPLLDAVGPKGMYVTTDFTDRKAVDALLKAVEPYY